MARYPTYEEYAKNGKFQEGIARCNALLSKTPQDMSLLITKLQLICTSTPSSAEGPRILDQLVTRQPPIQDLNDLESIEIAVIDSFKNTYPPPRTAGPAVAKLWENAFKANSNANYRSELLNVRYQRAVYDNRIQDVQQTLIQLKHFQPKNRAFYMAHAAYTQLLSTGKDDLQSKLALGLARKAVSESFDDEPRLDCRVAGQIFAMQESEKDLESIRERQAFRESRQVYDALQLHRQPTTANDPPPLSAAPTAQELSPREWLESASEKLKTRFKAIVDENASTDAQVEFVVDAMKLFHTAISSLELGPRKRSAADPSFLAISALVKLYSDSGNQTYLLQAAFLAEQLLKFEPHVHEARLILVYLYMRLGLGSEAMRLFESLGIKEVQYDTVGHTLFTRLSTTHPFRVQLPTGDFYDPHERTAKALHVPPRHEGKLSNAEAAVLDHNQTGMIFELNGLRDEIRHSFMRRVTLLEHRRTARLSGKGYSRGTSDIGPRVIAAWTNLKDNRDFNAAFNFGYNVEKALHGTGNRFGQHSTIPGRLWLIYNLAIDQAWSIASKQVPLISDNINDSLVVALHDEKANAQLTQAESLAGYVIFTLLPILDNVTAGKTPSKQDLDLLTTQITRLNVDALCATKEVLAKNLHAHYVYTDVLLIVVQSCKFITQTLKTTTTTTSTTTSTPTPPTTAPPELSTLQTTATQHILTLQSHATALAATPRSKTLFGSVYAGLRRESTVAEELKMFREENLNAFADRVAESAKVGWAGVGRVGMGIGGS